MEYQQIIGSIKEKKYSQVYLLSGEEEYFIDKISDEIENTVLNESEKEFNQTVLYGAETDPVQIEAVAKRYPMMASYNVVIVKEAQKLKKLEKLKQLCQKPITNFYFGPVP